ncbi:hypothetical protein ScPMuIL_007527 [Solemya velum]
MEGQTPENVCTSRGHQIYNEATDKPSINETAGRYKRSCGSFPYVMNRLYSSPGGSLASLGSAESDVPRKKNKEQRRKKHSDSRVTKDILKIANKISSKLEECSASDSSFMIDLDRIGMQDIQSSTDSPRRMKIHRAREKESVNSDGVRSVDAMLDSESSDMELSQSLLQRKRDQSKSPKKIMEYLQNLNRADISPAASKKGKRKSPRKQLDIDNHVNEGMSSPEKCLLASPKDSALKRLKSSPIEKEQAYLDDYAPDISGVFESNGDQSQQKKTSRKKRKSKDRYDEHDEQDIISTKIIKREVISLDGDAHVLESDVNSQESVHRNGSAVCYEDILDKELWVIQAPVDFDISQLSRQLLACSGVQELKGSKKEGFHYEVHTAGSDFTQKLHPFLPSKQTAGMMAAQKLSGQLQVVKRIDVPRLPEVEISPLKKHITPPNLLQEQAPFGSKSPPRLDVKVKSTSKKKKNKHRRKRDK